MSSWETTPELRPGEAEIIIEKIQASPLDDNCSTVEISEIKARMRCGATTKRLTKSFYDEVFEKFSGVTSDVRHSGLTTHFSDYRSISALDVHLFAERALKTALKTINPSGQRFPGHTWTVIKPIIKAEDPSSTSCFDEPPRAPTPPPTGTQKSQKSTTEAPRSVPSRPTTFKYRYYKIYTVSPESRQAEAVVESVSEPHYADRQSWTDPASNVSDSGPTPHSFTQRHEYASGRPRIVNVRPSQDFDHFPHIAQPRSVWDRGNQKISRGTRSRRRHRKTSQFTRRSSRRKHHEADLCTVM
ncbi:hypothetical protein P7C73_g2359, partial [Tremellales sp. Uapishka_1]